MDGQMTKDQMHFLPDRQRVRRMTTSELCDAFLVRNLFVDGEIMLRHIDLDRVVLGGAVPWAAPLELDAPASFAAEYFTERRELGVLNVGQSGAVSVDGQRYEMAPRDVLYVGRGSRRVTFESDDPEKPARFYLVSYPAHTSYPTAHVPAASTEAADLGTAERANRRRLAKFIHAGGPKSAQLVMGVTQLETGNVWNTMPSHTHNRRTE